MPSDLTVYRKVATATVDGYAARISVGRGQADADDDVEERSALVIPVRR